MHNSIFKNFDTDEGTFNYKGITPLARASNIHLLIVQAITSCGRWQNVGNSRCLYSLNNSEFEALLEGIKELAKIGFENRDSNEWMAESDWEELLFEEYSITDWALHGKDCRPEYPVTNCQIHAMSALQIIDHALTEAIQSGINLNVIESIALAGFSLSEARDAEASESLDTVRFQVKADAEAHYKKRVRDSALLKANIRHAPTREARAFVQSEWAKYKSQYEQNKSLFVRSYIGIVANKFTDIKGDPLKITDKQMREVWLAESPSASKQAGLLAQG